MKHLRSSILALFAAVILSSLTTPPAVSAESVENGAPWTIQGAELGPSLHVPRDIRNAYTKATRQADGRPGPNYWQNHATHHIRLKLDPPSRRVQGEQDLVYTNNSPDALGILLFRLYMNAHQPEAMREKPIETAFLSKGMIIDEFRIDGVTKRWEDPSSPLASINGPGSTVHGIVLEKPLAPGASIKLSMRWHYDLVTDADWKEGATDDSSFFLAYFYPRLSNYSDYSGWDIAPFTLGREFNNDFNDYRLDVTVPRNFAVWATGTLQNLDDVLQPASARALRRSFESDKVIAIARDGDLAAGRITAQQDTVTWSWKADNVPDVAVSVSNHYLWDAASVVVDPSSGRRASVQSAYPASATDFRPMVDFGRKALRWASTVYPGVPYPYPKTTIVLGNADEEYPMMVNDASNVNNPMAKDLPENAFTRFVATHELLHSWFPFYMGINEKRYPFMDEGWTTAFEYLRNREDLGPEKADALFKNFRVKLVSWDQPRSGNELPIITPHDSLYGESSVFAFNQYGKAALGYLALKELMGDAAFRAALHEFMARWHGKRPLPWDMFNSFNDASRTDLNWFFVNWFFGYNYMDIAVGEVKQEAGGYRVTVRNSGGMAIPFDVRAEYSDGSSESFRHGPALWKTNPRMAEVSITSSKTLKSLTLDSGIFVDFNPADNIWKN